MEAQGYTAAGSARPAREVIGGSSSTRTTADYRESVGYDDAGRLVFDARPGGETHATLVFASSLFAELQRNYRREVLLARRAAAAGIRTIRFHYRGAGNSIAAGVQTDLETMTEDLRDIMASVDGPRVLIGARVGAIAAARLRAETNVPLILWEPVVRGDRWVEEVIRAALAREIGRETGVDADTIRRRWSDDGVAHVLGETVPREVVDQVGDVVLEDLISGDAPVMVVQMARNEKVKADVARLVDALAVKGVPAEVLSIVGKQTWWVNEGGDLFRPMERDEATSRLVEGVVGFVHKACP